MREVVKGEPVGRATLFLRGLGVFRRAMIAKSIERLGDGRGRVLVLRGVGKEPCAGEGGEIVWNASWALGHSWEATMDASRQGAQ